MRTDYSWVFKSPSTDIKQHEEQIMFVKCTCILLLWRRIGRSVAQQYLENCPYVAEILSLLIVQVAKSCHSNYTNINITILQRWQIISNHQWSVHSLKKSSETIGLMFLDFFHRKKLKPLEWHSKQCKLWVLFFLISIQWVWQWILRSLRLQKNFNFNE